MEKTLALIVFIILLGAILGFGPIITIWSLNTVFGTTIVYNFATWFGTLWLGAIVAGATRSQTK